MASHWPSPFLGEAKLGIYAARQEALGSALGMARNISERSILRAKK